MQRKPEEKEGRPTVQRGGLLIGACVFVILLLLPAPPALSPAGWKTAAVATLMAVWWMTEAIPILVTALLPLVLFPLLDVLAMPVMAGIASGLEVSALTLMTTAALSTSMAFMLPVATPPNTIVFSANYLTIPHMTRAGVWMNLIAIVVITLAVTCLVPVLLIK